MTAKTLVQLRRAKFGDGIAMGLPLKYSQYAVLVSLESCSLKCPDMVILCCDLDAPLEKEQQGFLITRQRFQNPVDGLNPSPENAFSYSLIAFCHPFSISHDRDHKTAGHSLIVDFRC